MTFSELPLSGRVLNNLTTLGYEFMTPVQEKSLRFSLAGKDVLAQAKTGSGKTAAFGISLLPALEKSDKLRGPEILVLCPTRELADQVAKEIRRLARCIPDTKVLTLCGGTPFGPQAASLGHGAHCIVGTPGRVQDHLRKRTLDLRFVRQVVLDEADRMLDMGFSEVLEDIMTRTSEKRQTLMFSATFPESVQNLCGMYQKNPVRVRVDEEHSKGQIVQETVKVSSEEKFPLLTNILQLYQPESAVVFCNTKAGCQEIADNLQKMGIPALAIHGDLEQRDRDLVLSLFRNKSCPVLVATNVAARGLDIKDLQLVVNFELSRDLQEHVHRSGRTGRAGKKGTVINLLTERELGKMRAALGEAPELREQTFFNKAGSDNILKPSMIALRVEGGKKHKLRPGDILGALTAGAKLPGSAVGVIDIFDFHSLVAVSRNNSQLALSLLNDGKIKGRNFKVKSLNIQSLFRSITLMIN